ncbi:polysaccharide deacetylase family protein [Clostridium perfringens]|uniref:polysaccharide deacetylase family protein n=1 Tax=Clostridium perfringens TaxID=1502 RepID=UPI0024BCA79B|nr:polysaccharide deacetylase family protein [Clostridium perfringens]
MKKFAFLLFAFIFSFSALATSPKYIKAADLEEENTKKIFLTFDDGPGGKVTEEILNTLKENDVKATFFLIGELVEQHPDLVKRMNDEGHSIGVHTFTHERNKIYRNNASFLEENLKAQKSIENVIGKKVFSLRFPFGSNNSTYTLKKSLVDSLHEQGFRIYDWTVDSTDAINPNLSPSSIIQRSISNSDYIVLLMHCGYSNKNSAKALPSIIKHFKSAGYSFQIIDENTPEIYRLKNKC